MMTKSPEEIKRGLETCYGEGSCDECPYHLVVEGSFGCDEMGCDDSLMPDAMAYIQQLEKIVFDQNMVILGKQDVITKQERVRGDLQDEIYHLKQKLPKWISVEERLPPVGKAVLVYAHSVNNSWSCVMIDMWDGAWLENADSEWHKVTHWMPLPEPPKEDV